MEMISGCEDYDDFMQLKEVNFRCRDLMIYIDGVTKIAPRLQGFCGGDVALIGSAFTHLHKLDTDIGQTLSESI